MDIQLPKEVDYSRDEKGSGEAVYKFKHRDFGVLGSLRVVPDDIAGSRLVWEPFGAVDGNDLLPSPPRFVVEMMKALEKYMAMLRKRA